MSRLEKILAIYSLVSGCAMIAIWAVLFARGVAATEASHNPIAFPALLAAEGCTSLSLIIGSLGLFRGRDWGFPMSIAANGMLLYAGLYGCGHFAQADSIFMAGLLALVSAATVTLLLLSIAGRRRA